VRRQRGVALLTAVLLVALATMVATSIAFDSALLARRGAAAIALDEGLMIAGGAEALAAYALAEDGRGKNPSDYLGESWSLPIGPVEVVPGALLEARIEDLGGRFNLNALVDAEGKKDKTAYEVFERLLENLELEAKWADLVVDWIDDDSQAEAQGAEASFYTAQSPGYRAADMAITSVSELLALPGFGAERYARLAPHVAALPRNDAVNSTPVNVCTATGPLLDALSNQKQFTQAPKALELARKGKCFPGTKVFESYLPADELARVNASIGIAETSEYFQLRSLVTIGTTELALYSLLRRESPPNPGNAPKIRVMARGFTE
jgi:general secretion pathway protein K